MSEIICRQIQDDDERSACFKIRKQVFVDEQKLFMDTDIDQHDETAVHLAAFINGRIIGTVRIYKEEADIWVGGRLAVKKGYRGRAGKLLVLKEVDIVKESNAKIFKATIQAENVKFFTNLKWGKSGKLFLHYGKKHQLMEAQL